MGTPPRVTLNGSQSARDQWPPIPLLHCAGAALYSIFKHMPTPKRRRNSTWPLETGTLESKGEGKLFNEDGSQWWLYISFLNSGHTALLQPVLTFVLPLSDEALERLCVLTLVLILVSFLGGVCVSVCMVPLVSWMYNLLALWNLLSWLVNREMLTIQSTSIWPHSSWSSCSESSPVKWCPLSALNVTSPMPLLQIRIPTECMKEKDLLCTVTVWFLA